MARRIVAAHEQVEMLTPWRWFTAALQQRPKRPGEESEPNSWSLWKRPAGVGDDFDLFDDEYGRDHRTSSVDFPYLRNNNGMRHIPGFDQSVEPWGRYMSHDTDIHHLPLESGWERGTVSFSNPLFIPHEYGAWKQTLADQYGSTGRQLSEKLMADGYDGVVTHDKYGIGEIVDVRPKGQRGHHPNFMGRTS